MHRIKYSYHDIIALEGSRSCGSVPVAFLPETEPFLEDTVQLAVALTLLCQRLYENLSGACLHLCTAGEPAPALPMAPPVNKMRQDANEPQDSIREDHPYRILHSLEVTVPISIFVDVHLNRVSCISRWHGGPEREPTLPTMPKSAIQRMKRIKFQAHTKAKRRTKGTQKRMAVRAERPPTTSAYIHFPSASTLAFRARSRSMP